MAFQFCLHTLKRVHDRFHGVVRASLRQARLACSSFSRGVFILWGGLNLFIAIASYFFIVETKGLSLEETAALFDGEDAQRAVTAAHEVRHDEVDEKASGDLKA